MMSTEWGHHPTAYWRTKLGGHTKLRVGLVWSGGFRPNQPEVWDVNERRNIPLELVSRINVPEFDFYSLQKGEPAESELLRRKQNVWPETNLFNVAYELKDFSDTAPLIENLDLVITVDTDYINGDTVQHTVISMLIMGDQLDDELSAEFDAPRYADE